MALTDLLNTPATIIRRTPDGGENKYGDATAKPEEVPVVGEFQKRVRKAGEEIPEEGDMSDSLWLALLPAETTLDSGDAIDITGLGKFEVEGEPWHVRNPRTQTVSHIEVNLRRTAGAGEE